MVTAQASEVQHEVAVQAEEGEVGSADPEYMVLLREALMEFEARHWEEAYHLFEAAHRRFPNSRTLRALGVTSYELREYPRAVTWLTAALASQTRPLEPGQRRDVERLLERAERFVGRLKLEVQPATANVYLAGHRVEGRDFILPLGAVQIRVALDGHRDAMQVVNIGPGANEARVVLTPISAPAADASSSSDAVLASTPKEGSTPFGQPPFIIALSAAGAGLVTFVVAGTLAVTEENELATDCKPGCTDEQVAGLDRLTLIADIGLGAAVLGGLVAAGIALFDTGRADSTEVAVVPHIGAETIGVTAGWAL